MFIELLEEIQEQILEYCSTADLKNLTLTNSVHNEVLRPYLYKAIRVPETELLNEQELLDQLNTFENTVSLHLRTDIHSFSTVICEVIATFNKLQELYLPRWYDSNNTKLDDTHVGILCSTLINLRILDLSGSNITAKGSSSLLALKKLRKLILVHCRKLDFKAVRNISIGIPLVELNLGSSPIGTISFSEVCKMGQLQSLDLSWCEKLTLMTFGMITRLRELTELKLNGLALDSNNFASVCQLNKLEVLEIGLCDDISNLGFQHISRLVKLRVLKMNGCAIGNHGFESVCKLTELERLDMGFCKNVVGMGYTPITKLVKLKKLRLDGCCLGDFAFSQVCQLASLDELHMCQCVGLDGVTMTDLSSLKSLEKLYLTNSEVSRSLRDAVRTMPGLQVHHSNGDVFIMEEDECEDRITLQDREGVGDRQTQPSSEALPASSFRQRRKGEVNIMRSMLN